MRILSTFLAFVVLFAVSSCGMGVSSGSGPIVPGVNGATTAPNADGSVTVTISGTGFVDGMTVTVNSTPCTDVRVLSASQLTCVLPNGSIALVNIVVTSPSGGSSGSGSAVHVIFAASEATGNLGGLAGADILCQTQGSTGSATQNLAGTWRAILSDSTTNAKDRITFTNGAAIKNTNGETLANQGSDLWTTALLAKPKYKSTGVGVHSGNSEGMFTGSNVDGTRYTAGGSAAQNNCDNWTSSSAANSAARGNQESLSAWLNNGTALCNSSHARFYCINSNN